MRITTNIESRDGLGKLRENLMLVVTTYPGQPESIVQAPKHLRESLRSGYEYPFMRLATNQELIDFGREHSMIEQDPRTGSW
jgi:hypothetical protein